MIKKSLSTLSLNISEKEYRDLPILSQSSIAKYEKEGFPAVAKLYEHQESDAMTFGSMVDAIITEGIDAFKEKFLVADIKEPTDTMAVIIKIAMEGYNTPTFDEISDEDLIAICDSNELIRNIKDPAKKVAKIREGCTEYYNLKQLSKEKTIVSSETYEEVLATVGALKNSPQSSIYLGTTNEEDGIEFLYQQKFTTELDGLKVKMMSDILIVNHNEKIILPFDLKTTSVPEYDFQKKFVENRYDIQSRLYWRILDKLIKEDEYFKDFTLGNFKFLVVNKNSNLPLVFEDEYCKNNGDIEVVFKSNYKKIFRDPVIIGKELQHYLDTNAIVPDDVFVRIPNKLYERMKRT